MYPASNSELAREISEHGAVISEFPFGRKPDKTTFPMRNRVVSGLSMGVVVVEADRTSGAMITVDQALEQGRCVFAVPGRIDSYLSAGPHYLIRNGARLVEGVDDILDELGCLVPGSARSSGKPRSLVRLSEEEQCLMRHLEDGEQSMDGLTRATGLPSARVTALLIGLEMKKQVRMLPGQMVERISNTQSEAD
jgi:DNA processing protein